MVGIARAFLGAIISGIVAMIVAGSGLGANYAGLVTGVVVFFMMWYAQGRTAQEMDVR